MKSPLEDISIRIIQLIQSIPRGRVASYGQIAALAGDPRGARRVARLLHSSSDTRDLPWHRVINASGRISFPRGAGYELQRAMLESEGIVFTRDRVEWDRFGWKPILGKS